MKLAIIGGTGTQGAALATRFARAGVQVLIGSRDAARAQAKASALNTRAGVHGVMGFSNRAAAANADLVLLAVPYEGMSPILDDIRDAVQNKIVINIASALDPERKSRAKLPPAGSISAEVQQFFGAGTKVVAAFQNIAPEKLESDQLDSDVLVCGEKAARESVIELIQRTGIRAIDAGVLANAAAVEALTAVLIAINIKYKIKGAGIRITGI